MKNQNVKKDDYELYSFPMPFLLKRSRRDNYIAKKLEQLHPCFSDSCCYDAKYKLKRGRLIASVAVMDKLKLAEYKTGKKRHQALKFGDANKLEFFNGEKILNIALFVSLALLVGILFTSYAFHAKSKEQKQKQKQEAVVSRVETSADEEALVRENIFEAYKCLEKFLDAGTKAHGFIKSCSLVFLQDQGADGSYKMHFSLANCFPQDFADFADTGIGNRSFYSAVTYSNSLPEFSATLEGKAEKTVKLEHQMTKMQIDDVRLSVWGSNGILITDFSDEGTVEFLLPNRSIAEFVKSMTDVCKRHSIFPATMDIEESGINTRMKIVFAEKIRLDNCNPLALLERYSEVFFRQGAAQKATQRIQAAFRTGSSSVDRGKSERESFGKIIQKDGSVLVFYKNSQGKITGEKQ